MFVTVKKCVPVNRNSSVKRIAIGKFLSSRNVSPVSQVTIHNNNNNRYNPISRDNCLLCDRPFTHLDIYADVEPDRDFDIYSMSDDPQVCKAENYPTKDVNARKLKTSNVTTKNNIL